MHSKSSFLRLLRVVTAFLMFAILAVGCRRYEPDPRLLEAEAEIYKDPVVAMADLQEIDVDRLNASDRHLYDLLTIKAADKAYKVHTSDSLILRTIDYFRTHGPKGRYSEALYYGGRVYSDLGDAPSALDYFQQALDNLPKDSINSDFEGNLVSQTGRLLSNLRMFDEAVPYLERSLKIDELLNDSLYIFYDLSLLGENSRGAHNYYEAEKYFIKANEYASSASSSERAMLKILMADILMNREEKDSAIRIVRNNLDSVRGVSINTALIYAAKIYRKAGLYDTAYIYADKIIHNDDPSQKYVAYGYLFYPELQSHIPTDSLRKYTLEYSEHLERKFNDQALKDVMDLRVIHETAKNSEKMKKLEKSRKVFEILFIITAFILILSGIAIYHLKRKQKEDFTRTTKSLFYLQEIKDLLTNKNENELKPVPKLANNDTIVLVNENLRKMLRQQIYEKASAMHKTVIEDIIMKSELIKTLYKYPEKNQVLKEDDPIWQELELLILEVSPSFKYNLNILTDTLSDSEFHTILLIRAGFSPSFSAKLLGRVRGTMTARRNMIGEKLYGEKIPAHIVDRIIYSL